QVSQNPLDLVENPGLELLGSDGHSDLPWLLQCPDKGWTFAAGGQRRFAKRNRKKNLSDRKGSGRSTPPAELAEAPVDPVGGQLLLDAVLAEAAAQRPEIHLIERLILVEAGEDDRLLSRLRIGVTLEALGADLLHHALHRRVDGADRVMLG